MRGFDPTSKKRFLSSFATARNRHAQAAGFAVGIAGAYVLRESQRWVPYEFGALAETAQVTTNGSGFDTEARVAYTEDYAAAVHEKVDMKLIGEPRPSGVGRYWQAARGWGSAKFLERVPREQSREILRTYVRAFHEHLRRTRRANRTAADPRTYFPTGGV